MGKRVEVWGEVRENVGRGAMRCGEVCWNVGKYRGSCWESVRGECGGCWEVWEKVWKSVGGDFF